MLPKSTKRGSIIYCTESNDEMVYEMNHIRTADMKSSEAMIFAVMSAIFAIA